ncbi:hypothetical protein ZIOFF_029368 [Zingiber officinale]|uniref:5' exonuclease Apollo n=1 Tax=Zingiber officinale TaxID=94328 RepID=A0A8J5H177_ZINOF|nr:hypothetical protein ZIOFF_029368 [Zingiber officinale]
MLRPSRICGLAHRLPNHPSRRGAKAERFHGPNPSKSPSTESELISRNRREVALALRPKFETGHRHGRDGSSSLIRASEMEKGMVSIDRWNEGSQAYFLTHLHDDHTAGLSASWRRGPLFCSPITASLLPFRFRGFDVSLLRVIEVGATRALDLVSPTSRAPVRVLVTPIDAHHCPGTLSLVPQLITSQLQFTMELGGKDGALMYLFHGTFGWVLYTGDFRWELSSERSQLAKRMLLDVLQGNAIDVLYMDNTYCNPSFSFPPREVATKQVIDIIVTHPDHDIVIGIDNLGKEELLVNISKALNIKIRVWPERLRTMHLLGYKDVFTTNTSLTRVRAIPRYSFTFETIDGLNQLRPTIGIMPSGLPWLLDASKNTTLYASPLKSHQSEASPDLLQHMPHARKLKHNAYCVPYSEHSCFSEIAEFIKVLQPSNISGIVSSTYIYINPRYYFSHVDRYLSDKSCESFKSEVNQMGSSSGCQPSLKVRKEWKIKYVSPRPSVLVRRVSRLPRARRGAKIEESDSRSGS